MAEQETARLVPTRPGWWWARRRGGVVHAYPVLKSLTGAIVCNRTFVDDLDWDWLAPIPDPATCAAWVAAGRPGPEVLRALANWADLDFLVEGDHWTADDQPTLQRLMRRREAALLEVAVTMRAARDGAGEVGDE